VADNKEGSLFLRVVWAIMRKDLAVEWRSRQILTSMLVFSMLVVMIFHFALDLSPALQQEAAAGVVWLTFTFAATLGLNRSAALEMENSCLDGLLLAPVDRAAILFGKAGSNLVLVLALELVVLPLVSLLFNINLLQPGLLLVVLLGSLGYILAGTMLSMMAMNSRTRDMLLPLLLLPVVLPLLIPAVRASMYMLQGQGTKMVQPHLNLLIAIDVIYLALAYMTFDQVVEE